MKKLLITSAAFFAASTALFAQSLTVSAPGYSGAKLFDASLKTKLDQMKFALKRA